MDETFKIALAFVQSKHAGQMHGNIPVWHHLARVSHRLDFFLNHFGEGEQEERDLLKIAALGHDLLEDTTATKDEIVNIFGVKGYELIFGMTNEWGDTDVTRYVKKVNKSVEEIRLIKLSDLNDNLQNVTHNIAALGYDWTLNHFFPIVTPMIAGVLNTNFTKYPQTANVLVKMVEANQRILSRELDLMLP